MIAHQQDPLAILVMPRIGYMDALRSAPGLPLSLLAAAAPSAQRHRLALLDLRLVKDWQSALTAMVGPSTKAVAITAFTGTMIASGLEVARYAKSYLGLQVIWGGVHGTLEPESTAKDPNVDWVISGEGERPLAAVFSALARNELPDESIPGLFSWSDGRLVGGPQPLIEDLDELSDVPYDLVDVADYLPEYEGRKSFYYQSSRGCPRACTYCYNRKFNQGRWRAEAPERTITRIESARKRFGFEDVYLLDDNFVVDRERALTIAEGFMDLPLTWQIQGVEIADLLDLDDSDLTMLVKSGCRRMSVGVETGSARVRRLLGKRGTPDDIRTAMEKLRKHDILVYASFMTALPGETEDDIRATIAIHGELPEINPNVRTSPIYNYCPYPGTPLFRKAVELGFVPPTTLEGWARITWEDAVRGGGAVRSADFYEALYFASLFRDAKVSEYSKSKLIRLAAAIYRPIVRYRLEHMEFRFMPEVRLGRRWLSSR